MEFERLSKDITTTRPNFEVPQKKVQKETSMIIAPLNLDFIIPPVPFPLSYPSTPVTESDVIGKSEVKRSQGQLSLTK